MFKIGEGRYINLEHVSFVSLNTNEVSLLNKNHFKIEDVYMKELCSKLGIISSELEDFGYKLTVENKDNKVYRYENIKNGTAILIQTNNPMINEGIIFIGEDWVKTNLLDFKEINQNEMKDLIEAVKRRYSFLKGEK